MSIGQRDPDSVYHAIGKDPDQERDKVIEDARADAAASAEHPVHGSSDQFFRRPDDPNSPEGVGFDDPYGDGQDSFDLTVLAGDPRLPGLIATILKNYFGFQDNSRLCAHTYCEVDYFRKEPEDMLPKPIGS